MEDGFGFHNHAGATTEWAVVCGAVFICRPVAQIVYSDFYQALMLCTLEDTFVKYGVKHFRENGEDIDKHKPTD